MTDTLRLARPPTLTLLAAEKLRDAIISGRFEPGQRLVETELSEQFGVSRAPLREAMRVLAGDGLVEIRQSRGGYVIDPSPAEVEQMVLFRAMIEGTAARLITATPEHPALAQMEDALARMRISEESGDSVAFMAAHWLFHEHLCIASQNRFLIQSWANISNIIKIFLSKTLARLPDRSRILRNMSGFLRCFRAGDPDLAEAVLRSMIIWMGFELLGTTIPDEISGYVTHLIGMNGEVVPVTDELLAPRLRSSEAARMALPVNRLAVRQMAALGEAK